MEKERGGERVAGSRSCLLFMDDDDDEEEDADGMMSMSMSNCK